MLFQHKQIRHLVDAGEKHEELRDNSLLIGTRWNGFFWAIDREVIRSDLDLSDHEDWIYRYLATPSDGVYVDVGGFVGSHAIRIAKTCGCRVIVCEPVPRHVELMQMNCSLNNAELEIHQTAIGSETGKVPFKISGPGGSCVLNEVSVLDAHVVQQSQVATANGVMLPITTLDELLVNEGRVDVIKIDVEGYEYHVLQGAVDVAKRLKPHFVVEVHSHIRGYSANGTLIAQWCDHNGYAYHQIWDNGNGYYYLEMRPKDG